MENPVAVKVTLTAAEPVHTDVAPALWLLSRLPSSARLEILSVCCGNLDFGNRLAVCGLECDGISAAHFETETIGVPFGIGTRKREILAFYGSYFARCRAVDREYQCLFLVAAGNFA